ncbi:hypothetical protein D0Z67_29395 (plasmid) [Streptomyces seoulensis]|uniref:Uncharacterized protein n=1 Tax=Streptomyces seoulensis TaxID=73044 RepID=A0A4P6U2Y5_STRSO|nr:hypothetical protein [Streptomyces seoulensis]QBJ94485.1 hypothetical protein D0Z67_29395 [Streptomyces seoulensis]
MSAARDQVESWLARASSDEVELEEAIGDLDDYRDEVLREAKAEVVAWLAKKAREGEDIGVLASKVDRGAIRLFLDIDQ